MLIGHGYEFTRAYFNENIFTAKINRRGIFLSKEREK